MAKIKTSFSGHDKFDCKIDWITKGLEAYKEDNTILLQSNFEKKTIEKLGLGSNMLKSLHHWMKVFALIDGEKLTILGETILEKDPYLENSDTLWILHWNLVKNQEKASLYNLFFNQIYPNKFSKDEIFDYITNWLNDNEINLSPTTLKSDIDVFIRMYNSSNGISLLSELNIITKLSQNNYSLNINSVTPISDELFLYILCDYIQMQYNSNISSISIDDIQRGKLSIQKSLCMSEHYLYSKIDKLSMLTNNKFSYSETAGIRQIYISEHIDKLEILNKIYKGK